MSYDPYRVYDRLRYEGRISPRCFAMSSGDRCEYRRHTGTAHAAKDGSHLWIEAPLGTCACCGNPQYPLGVTVEENEHYGRQFRLLAQCCDDTVEVPDPRTVAPYQDEFVEDEQFHSRAEWRER